MSILRSRVPPPRSLARPPERYQWSSWSANSFLPPRTTIPARPSDESVTSTSSAVDPDAASCSRRDTGMPLSDRRRVASRRIVLPCGWTLSATSAAAVTRISVASVYPAHFTDKFLGHLGEKDATVVHRVDANARTDHDLARWGDDRIVALATRAAQGTIAQTTFQAARIRDAEAIYRRLPIPASTFSCHSISVRIRRRACSAMRSSAVLWSGQRRSS